MCELNNQKIVSDDIEMSEAMMFGKRAALWELPAHQICTVIGTCLDMSYLKKVKTRFSNEIEGVCLSSDYDYHSYFVGMSASKNIISKAMNKHLNKLYQRYIININSCKTDVAIRKEWSKVAALKFKNLEGYFWAVISSKYASHELKGQIYGEVHMLCHDIRKVTQNTQQKTTDENQALLISNEKKQHQIKQKNILLVEQRLKLQTLNVELSRLHFQLKKDEIDDLKNNEGLIQLQQTHINNLQKKLDLYESKDNKKEATTLSLDKKVIDLFALSQNEKISCDGDCISCDKTDLCGKKILYVGGFSRHRRKFQQVTNSINGEFFYHDGGKQQSEHMLDALVKKADCIFCPVDCISHSAIGRIKTLAKIHCKDCVFLRSASLSAFNAEVRRYAN